MRNGKKGGKASGANKRRSKSIAQIISTIEKLPLNEVGKSYLKRGGLDLAGVDPEDLTMMDGAVAGVFLAALKGNPRPSISWLGSRPSSRRTSWRSRSSRPK